MKNIMFETINRDVKKQVTDPLNILVSLVYEYILCCFVPKYMKFIYVYFHFYDYVLVYIPVYYIYVCM